MKKRKLLHKFVTLLFILLLLGGCWDKKEIEKRAYVIAIGLDKGKDYGFKITYLIANPDYGTQQQGGGTDEPSHEIISFETGDIITAESKANAIIAKEISYDLLRNIVVSEKLAKDKNFIRFVYDTTKQREIRRDVFFIVTKEDTETYFSNNKPKLESRAHKYYDLIIRRGSEVGLIPDSKLHNFLRITEADADLFLAIYSTTEKETEDETVNIGDNIVAGQFQATGETNVTQFLGSAIFKEGVMIGKLTGEEQRMANLLTNIKLPPEMTVSVPDPFNKEFTLAVELSRLKNNDIQMDLKEGMAKINVTVPLIVDVLSDQSMVNYAESLKKREKLKQYLEDGFTQKMEALIKKSQDEFKGDPFGWSLIGRKRFLTIPEYHKFNWMEKYPDMDVTVKVDIRFGNFGRQTKLPQLKDVRD